MARRTPPVSAATPSSWLPGWKPCPPWDPMSAALSAAKPAVAAAVAMRFCTVQKRCAQTS
eukprot:416663-Alexandrium_andersonii.AAC.1